MVKIYVLLLGKEAGAKSFPYISFLVAFSSVESLSQSDDGKTCFHLLLQCYHGPLTRSRA